MNKLKEDGDYWVTENDYLFLIHRLWKDRFKNEIHICVGEAVPRDDGYWEVTIGRSVIGIADSKVVALEVLWEQRNYMCWDYLH